MAGRCGDVSPLLRIGLSAVSYGPVAYNIHGETIRESTNADHLKERNGRACVFATTKVTARNGV